MISDDVALREMGEALFRQRKLVEDLKQDLADRRALAGLRYGALQKQIEKTAESAEGGGGLFGDILGGIGDMPVAFRSSAGSSKVRWRSSRRGHSADNGPACPGY